MFSNTDRASPRKAGTSCGSSCSACRCRRRSHQGRSSSLESEWTATIKLDPHPPPTVAISTAANHHHYNRCFMKNCMIFLAFLCLQIPALHSFSSQCACIWSGGGAGGVLSKLMLSSFSQSRSYVSLLLLLVAIVLHFHVVSIQLY